MGLIAYPPVYDAKRVLPVRKAFAKDKRERMIRSAIYTKEFIKQAQEARGRADEAKRLAEKLEARRQGLLSFKRRSLPEWARQIVEESADRHNICVSDLASNNRKYKVVHARNEAIYRIKERKPQLSSPHIGRWFDRNHVSILYAIASYSDATGAPMLVGYDLANSRERKRERCRREAKRARAK